MVSLRAILLAFMMMLACTAAKAAERVTFAGDDLMLRAILYRPDRSGPFPAVIALHGCAGLYGRDGSLSPESSGLKRR